MGPQNEGRLRSALTDAGCSQSTIAEIVACADAKARKSRLLCHRENLLKKLHTVQKQIDILDYIVRWLDGKETIL